MADFSAPVQHADTESTIGYAAVFADQAITERLVEKLDPDALGLTSGVGDLARTGSDTLTLTHYEGWGWHEEFQAMSSETEEIPLSGWSATNDTVSIARYGLGKEETFTRRILARDVVAFIENLAEKVPDSLRRTIMTQLCTAFQSIATSVGTSGALWSVDAELDLVSRFNETEGFEGEAVTVRHMEHFTQLNEALRNEPSFSTPEMHEKIIRLQKSGVQESWMGFRNISSARVTQSGGDHIGAAYAPGAFARARASTNALAGLDPGMEIVLPNQSLYIGFKTTSSQGRTAMYANAWFGLAQRNTNVAPAYQLLALDV